MKTSEFIKYVRENWFMILENNDTVINIGGIMRIHTNRQLIEFDKKTASSKEHLKLIEKAIEYTETPIEEREEVKKYRLKLNELFISKDGRYLNFNTINGKFDFNTQCELNIVKTSFTQQEIDAMPFDTNFFIKEEVK